MRGIIDVHAHILPGVDDGSENWEETRWMLECAYEQGIRGIIATPHYSRGQNPAKLRALCGQLQDEAKKLNENFHIYMGQEILYFDGLVEALKAGHALTMAGTRYVLVEFMPETPYGNIYQAVRRILVAGYRPVIAHVERYRSLREGGRLEDLKDSGCLLQMNYKSLEGGLLDRRAKWCRQQVREGTIDLLGTDAHHRQYRTPEISKSLKWLQGHVDSRQILAMTRKNVIRMIQGEDPYTRMRSKDR